MQTGGRLTGYMRILTGSQNGARRLSFEHISDVEKHRENGTFAKDNCRSNYGDRKRLSAGKITQNRRRVIRNLS